MKSSLSTRSSIKFQKSVWKSIKHLSSSKTIFPKFREFNSSNLILTHLQQLLQRLKPRNNLPKEPFSLGVTLMLCPSPNNLEFLTAAPIAFIMHVAMMVIRQWCLYQLNKLPLNDKNLKEISSSVSNQDNKGKEEQPN